VKRITAFTADLIPQVREQAAGGFAITALTDLDPFAHSLHDEVVICHACRLSARV
jgi:hypothetical protein